MDDKIILGELEKKINQKAISTLLNMSWKKISTWKQEAQQGIVALDGKKFKEAKENQPFQAKTRSIKK